MSDDSGIDIDQMFDVFNEPPPDRKKNVDFDAVREKTKKVFDSHSHRNLQKRKVEN